MEILSAAVITALVQGLKTSFGIPGRWNFVLAVVLGVVLSVAVSFSGDGFGVAAVLDGLLVGLGASGLYSGGVKPIIEE